MRQSTLFTNTLRQAPSDAEVNSHKLLLRAGFIRQLASGIYTYLPLGWRVLKKVQQIVREEMDRSNAQEFLMPAMQPAELWKESGRYSVYGPELIRLKDRHDREFALGPTHEEVVTTLVRNEINSYKRLPITLYQIQTKFRDERRPRYGPLRCREFLMKDAYSFDTSWEGLDHTYKSMYEAYHHIFTRCGLHFKAVEAEAGAIGGEGDTHEFIALTEIGEDTIVTCSHCDYAVNMEVAQASTDSDPCPHCIEGTLLLMKGIEIGHVFKLGTKYSEGFNAKYLDSNGKEMPFIMGCYGIGVSRIMSAVIEQNHDDRGMIWPSAIAPFHVHIIPVSTQDRAQMQMAEELYSSLKGQGVEVLIDDRDERTGVKLNDSDLIGIPIRFIIGKYAIEGNVEFVERRTNTKQVLSLEQALSRVINI